MQSFSRSLPTLSIKAIRDGAIGMPTIIVLFITIAFVIIYAIRPTPSGEMH